MKEKGLIAAGGILLLLLLLLPVSGAAQQQRMESRAGRLALGVDIGLQAATADATAFAVGLSGEYFLTQNFSLGPLLQMGFTNDLFQIAPTIQAKYTFDLPDMPRLKPHLQGGIGFIHAELDRSGRPDLHDDSFLIPIGFGVEYRLDRNISIGTTFLFNFTDLNDVHNENFFFSWLTGLRLRF